MRFGFGPMGVVSARQSHQVALVVRQLRAHYGHHRARWPCLIADIQDAARVNHLAGGRPTPAKGLPFHLR